MPPRCFQAYPNRTELVVGGEGTPSGPGTTLGSSRRSWITLPGKGMPLRPDPNPTKQFHLMETRLKILIFVSDQGSRCQMTKICRVKTFVGQNSTRPYGNNRKCCSQSVAKGRSPVRSGLKGLWVDFSSIAMAQRKQLLIIFSLSVS